MKIPWRRLVAASPGGSWRDGTHAHHSFGLRLLPAVYSVLALTALLGIAQMVEGQSVQFGSANSYPAGSHPRSLVSGDFNGDGKRDLAVANHQSTDVSILLGNGNGTFQTAVNYPLGVGPQAIVAGDFNNDGKLDLATANQDTDTVSVLIGKGDGTFPAPVNYPVAHGPCALFARDLNGDGFPELVVAAVIGSKLSLLVGSKTGVFQSAVSYPVGLQPQAVASGDFNGDGKTDLVTCNGTSWDVSVLLGNGNGTFQPALNTFIGEFPVTMVAGDFNRDGKLDLVLGILDGGSIRVLLGLGTGGFIKSTTFHLGNPPTNIQTGDFNGDGKLDLVSAAVFWGRNLEIMLGQGDGTFQDVGSAVDAFASISVEVGDFNGDTKPDIAAIVDSQVNVVLLNLTPGNPDSTAYFVHQHYQDFLAREPDNRGFDFWTAQINACGNNPSCMRDRRVDTSAAFFVANEFQLSGYFVYRLYRAAFGRRPSFTEFSLDRPKVIGGPQLEANKAVLIDAFTQRDQFKAAYPDTLSKADFVNRLFDAAGLVPFNAERNAAINALNQGASRASVLRTLIENPAFTQREFNPAFVQMQYFGYLRRGEDQNGYQFWLDVMNRDPANYARMVCVFITSKEYQTRFSSAVTHTNAECP